jgi:CheY-like chemotaxis protein
VGQRGDAARCKELGVAAYLTKPVKQSILLDAIHAALDGPEEEAGTARPRPLITRHSIREGHRPLRVLLAEDNAINRALVMNLLRKHGHSVVVAATGREALDAHAREPFDVLLMDVQMPEMDGLEATAALRGREAASGLHLPIVALTAHAMTGDRERCLAAGMDFYLKKPLLPAELYDVLESAVPGLARVGDPAHATPATAVSLSFDPAEALARVEDDQALLGEIVGIFLAESSAILSALRASVSAGDAAALAASAHTLIGSVGNFGPSDGLDSALALQRMAGEGDLAEAAPRLAILEEQIARLGRDLAAFVAAPEAAPV